MMVDQLSMAVVGARFDNPRRKGQPTGNRQSEILMCVPGDPIELRPEPENEHDANAIAVYSERGVQLGYLSADRTPIIRLALADACVPSAIFQEATPWGCWLRIGLGVEPVLPPPRQRADAPAVAPDDAWDGVDYIPPDE